MHPEHATDAACELIRGARTGPAMIVIAIDGGVAAGKTTLAMGIRDRLSTASILRADHFFRPLNEYPAALLAPDEAYDLYFDWERMIQEALSPLRCGQSARYQRYDWNTDRLNQWVFVEPGETLLVEGVYSTRPELRALLDIAVFVETPREERWKRALVRGHLENDPDNKWLTPWMAAEDWYFANVRPHEYCDLRLAGL